ncbi:hypothetical protein BAUCODRAFT_33665 [Baudoinia panamericana UAMH 10762]|uniref:CID domain-containing protein n=1 Tax=Baudoinia panamericana (strain UAMH 10762) TaxID=717646 RepID=M2NB02_BAUPA|nr:uncharacterized protein BAUCODRAFT_33665 [Baudoinia panamericana UAMH 10762]EMC96329.1 hypothetical protein BAUCODRAFT_33665 [Baudoinia panamericana UAMH 10762]
MSALSPRGSISGTSDVAVDFEDSLRDLSRNDRYEIGNLTSIAREYTEYAQAISRVLENHIKTTAPNKKLPALYVLDSIVKNVGTPYTVYLGRNLYSTFMEAYTLVDGMTRRAMDSLLKTWKEPVPGSMDHRPVFPPEIVRPIENALIKAKTAALQNQRQVQQPPYRSTPTPPQYNGQYAVPPTPNQHEQYPQYVYGNSQAAPPQQQWQPAMPPPTPQQQPPFLSLNPAARPMIDVSTLRADISALISRLQMAFAASPSDQGLITQLHALLKLKQVVDSGAVPDAALQEVRTKVTALAAVAPDPRRSPQPPVPTPQWQATPAMQQPAPYQPPASVSQAYQYPGSGTLPFAQPAASMLNHTAPPLLAPNALNGLQALLANGQKPSTPQMRTAVPALQNMPHTQLNNVQNNITAAPTSNTADLLAALSKSGVLSSLPSTTPQTAPAQNSTLPPPNTSSTTSLLASLQSILPPSQNSTPTTHAAQPAGTQSKAAIPISNSALKTFRPELVQALYDNQPNQCSTCGRRFLATEEGRAKKQRHLDWHFRTNQRLADPNASRGQHRQWFLDEVEWISIPEFDPSTASAADTTAAATVQKKRGAQDQYIRAPAGITRLTCTVCQEEMKSSYSEELQDWVFTNAVYYNGKPAHATCVEEMKKPWGGGGGGSLAAALSMTGQRQRSATPESSLGKRKAEGTLAGNGARLKTG